MIKHCDFIIFFLTIVCSNYYKFYSTTTRANRLHRFSNAFTSPQVREHCGNMTRNFRDPSYHYFLDNRSIYSRVFFNNKNTVVIWPLFLRYFHTKYENQFGFRGRAYKNIIYFRNREQASRVHKIIITIAYSIRRPFVTAGDVDKWIWLRDKYTALSWKRISLRISNMACFLFSKKKKIIVKL